MRSPRIILTFGCSLFILTHAYAGDNIPGFSVTGMTGDFTQSSVDGLWPIFKYSNNLFYIAPQALYSGSSQYSGSVGTGIRRLVNNSAIFGAYLFNDYDHAPSGHLFSFLSPGIEVLTDRLDFSTNLYLPIGNTKNNTGQSFASYTGNYQYVSFSGHDQIDQIVNNYESVGIGLDGELSYRLPILTNNTKITGGCYYYNPSDAIPITGTSIRLDIPMSARLSLAVSDSYDNVFHNTVKVGLTLELGGRNTHFHDQSDLSARLLDPIERNLAANAGPAHTNQLIEKTEQLTGNYGISESNIWFFSSNSSQSQTTITDNSCTADNPCAWNQNNINGVNGVSSNANLYLASGSYSNSGQLTINNGQSVFGRSDDFTAPGIGNDRPEIVGSLNLQGNNDLQDLILQSDGIHTTGITVDDNAAALILKDLQIGGSSNNTYTVGIELGSNDQLKLDNSQIFVANNPPPLLNNTVTGIKIDGDSNNVSISQSLIQANGLGVDNTVRGIDIEGSNNQFSIIDSQISASNTGSDSLAFGIDIENNANTFTTIKQSQISANGSGNNDLTSGIVLGFFNEADNNSLTDISQTKITATSSASGSASAGIAILAGDYNDLSLTQSKIISDVNGFSSAGIIIGNGSGGGNSNSINLQNTDITADITGNENGAESVGISINGGNANLINSQNSQINATVSGDGQIASGLSIVGNENSVFLDQSVLSATASGTGSEANGIQTFSSTDNFFDINHSQIIASATGESSPAFGISDSFSSGNVFNISYSQISANTTGDNADAMAIHVEADTNADNQFTLTTDELNAWASGNNSDAFGIATGYFIRTTGNIFNIDSSTTIIANALNGNAFGLWDSSLGINTWNVNSDTIDSQISVKAGNGYTACSTFNVLLKSCQVFLENT